MPSLLGELGAGSAHLPPVVVDRAARPRRAGAAAVVAPWPVKTGPDMPVATVSTRSRGPVRVGVVGERRAGAAPSRRCLPAALPTWTSAAPPGSARARAGRTRRAARRAGRRRAAGGGRARPSVGFALPVLMSMITARPSASRSTRSTRPLICTPSPSRGGERLLQRRPARARFSSCQRTNLAIICSATSRCLRLNHTPPKSSSVPDLVEPLARASRPGRRRRRARRARGSPCRGRGPGRRRAAPTACLQQPAQPALGEALHRRRRDRRRRRPGQLSGRSSEIGVSAYHSDGARAGHARAGEPGEVARRRPGAPARGGPGRTRRRAGRRRARTW